MKVRQGFVSNSSSSSFVIKYSVPGEKCPCCGREDFNFIKLLPELDYDGYGFDTWAEGYDEIINHIKEDGWPECDEPDDDGSILLKKMKELNDGNNKFIYISVPRNLEQVLTILVENSKSMEILYYSE